MEDCSLIQKKNRLPRILLVDDDPSHLDIVANILCSDYDITATTCGAEALNLTREQRFDSILLDVVMPNMDGFTVCQELRSREGFYTPIVFLTGNDSAEQIEQGLELGAAYYLTKPINPKRLQAVIRTATGHSLSLNQAEGKFSATLQALGLMNTASFHFRTLSEARSLASLVAELCPNSDTVRLGLTELMINAVEHGNLGITYDEKSVLNEEGRWEDEVERRLTDPDLSPKLATLEFTQTIDKLQFTISDQGTGFNWKTYLSFDAERALDSHGRGIAMANMMSFDSLEYHGNGSSVTAIVQR